MHRDRLSYFLIPLAAFVAILPLLIYGCSCGHDFDFHILSWMEAARQFTHGNLHPHWAYTPAWNAGEPRFVFYPPLSWTIGAVLGLIFPWAWTPILYTWLALTAAGISLNYLARDFTSPQAALIAAILYTVNPYTLFTAYERTAYAELLAAAWIPLLLHAILRNKITIPRIAIPIALLWLTNAPAAVMSCYALALLTAIRVIANKQLTRKSPNIPPQSRIQLALNTIAGTALGLSVAAFYILPAAYERRFVQIAMAIIPFLRIQDNFLFHHTNDPAHDQVLHTASLIAITLITLTVSALLVARRSTKPGAPYLDSEMWASSEARPSSFHGPETSSITGSPRCECQNYLLLSLMTLTIAITLLLTPLTTFIWDHAPELAFLQFPWRLLAILAAVFALTLALVLKPIKLNPLSTTFAIVIAAALTYPAYRVFHQSCDPADTVEARLHLFHSNQGTDPTDEYTPLTSDNDSLAHTNPPYWLAENPNGQTPAGSQPWPAPTHFSFKATQPGYLILNLRDYPAWSLSRNDSQIPTHIGRADGLIALPIPAGPSTIDITYTHSFDQTMGDIISAIALITLLLTLRQKTPAPS